MTYSDTHNWAPSWCSGKLNPFVSKFRCVIASQTVNSHNSSINKSQARLLAVEHEWRHFVSKLVHGITSRPRNRNSEQTRKGPAVAFRRKAVKHDMMCVVCGCAAVLHRWHTRSACGTSTWPWRRPLPTASQVEPVHSGILHGAASSLLQPANTQLGFSLPSPSITLLARTAAPLTCQGQEMSVRVLLKLK